MIKRKIIELSGVGFREGDEGWSKVNALISLEPTQDDDEEQLLEIAVGPTNIAISVEDIVKSLAELGIDLEAWS